MRPVGALSRVITFRGDYVFRRCAYIGAGVEIGEGEEGRWERRKRRYRDFREDRNCATSVALSIPLPPPLR